MMNFDKIDAMLITSRENVRYITGFSGSAGVCAVFPDKKYLLTDFRYKEQSRLQAPDCEFVIIKGRYSTAVKEIMEKEKAKTLGFEPESLSYAEYISYSETAENFVPCGDFTKNMRIIKTAEELENIRTAADIASDALLETLPLIGEGVSELDIAAELDFRMRKHGASGNSFDTIAIGGKNSSVVHGTPGEYKLQSGDFLLIDFGCVYNGYCSDMTRTFAVGEISKRQREVYNTVLSAQEAALAALKPGAAAADVDKIARDIIEKAGFGDNFGHALGHGVGLQIHEPPTMNPKSDTVFAPGMTVTVEPGIYLEGEFGVRIEDLTVITDNFHQNLCQKIKKEVIYI